MIDVEPPLQSGPPAVPHESFCTYLAKQFIAKKGFELAQIPEVARLRDACAPSSPDPTAMRFRSLPWSIARHGLMRRLALARTNKEIGESCLKYTGTVHRNKCSPLPFSRLW
jgi:hypothetical protein